MSWCLCGHCIHHIHIEEQICCKNPLILPSENCNAFECTTLYEAFSNVCLNKDVLEAASAALRDVNNTDIKIYNFNYRLSQTDLLHINNTCGGAMGISARRNTDHCQIVQ